MPFISDNHCVGTLPGQGNTGIVPKGDPVTIPRTPGVWTKTEDEVILRDLNFAGRMRSGTTLTGFVSGYPTTTVLKGTSTSTPTFSIKSVSGQVAQYRVTGGTAGCVYRTTVQVTTSDGDTREGIDDFRVIDPEDV